MNRSLFINWRSKESHTKTNNKNNSNVIVNFGPQHPAAHGVLRLILELHGEVIERGDIHIGLLHRGTEKLMETKHYEKSVPYFDRLDYVSMMTQEHAYCLAVEKLQNIQVKNRFISAQRVLFDELTRIMNHFLAIACHALDVGSMSSIFWAFEEREKLMEFYERVTGARMHAGFHRPTSNTTVIFDEKLFNDILYFIKNCYTTLNEIHNMLTYNKIWKQRLINIGVYSLTDVYNYGLTGVMARCVGLKRDLRLDLKDSYSGYTSLNLKSFIGTNGDSYDRFLIRMFEMGESLSVANQCLNMLIPSVKHAPVTKSTTKTTNLANTTRTINGITKTEHYQYMEDIIEHFCSWHDGIKLENNYTSLMIESPKGEFGVHILSNNTNKPYRCKIRSPSYYNLQFLPKLMKGHLLGDLAALIGTIDIVFGEIDR